MQGIGPVAYALFGMALGIAAGALLRRTVPAIAVTLTGFIGVRVLVAEILRPHYLSAITTYYSVAGNWTQPAGAWVLGSGVVNKSAATRDAARGAAPSRRAGSGDRSAGRVPGRGILAVEGPVQL